MRVVWGFDNPPQIVNAIATVGSYDGVHCGHRILLDEVRRRAEECGGESVVLTFEPHPRITLGRADDLKLLSTFDEKCALLEREGIDWLVVIPFDEAFSRLSREEFIDDYLVKRLHIKQLILGYNHHFGHNKEGDHSFLLRHGALEVVQMAQYRYNGGKVSSTTIRNLINEGDISLARQKLGHPYIIIGIADAEGRVATDNYKLLPPSGTYACTINGCASECKVVDGVMMQRDFFSQKIEIEL